MKEEGRVSLCSADQCMYNQQQQCHAENVQVAVHEDHADCETFSAE